MYAHRNHANAAINNVCRYVEACAELEKLDFEVRTLYPEPVYERWKGIMIAHLRGIKLPSLSDYTLQMSFFMCLALCFDRLGDEASKVRTEYSSYDCLLTGTKQLAAQYQIVIKLFQSNKDDLGHKVEVLSRFGLECVQKV
jgi:hypothetical protein